MAESTAAHRARASLQDEPKAEVEGKPKAPDPQAKPTLIIPCFRPYDFDTLDEAIEYLAKRTGK